MNKEVLNNFIDTQIEKYDEMSSKAMSENISVGMNLTGISTGLYLVKTFIESLDEDSIEVKDIRNKLSPLSTLVQMLDDGLIGNVSLNDELDGIIKGLVEESKVSINYLAQRDAYDIKNTD